MKLIFKVLILFLIVFNFRIPVVYNSVVLADILVLLYYMFMRGAISVKYFFLRYNVIVLIGTVIITIIYMAYTILHGQYNFAGEKRLVLQFFMLSSFIFSLPLFIENEEDEAYEKIFVLICYAFAAQGLIHLAGYLYTPFGDFIYTLKPAGFKDFMENPEYGIDKFRGYALTGSIFFELPAAYGVACIMFFRLQLIEGQKYLTGIKAYIVLFFLIAGISLSGRTGFIGAFLGLFLYSLYSFNKFTSWLKNTWKIVAAVIFVLVFFYFLISPGQRNRLTDEVFPFAFEAYYNLRDRGSLSTGSSDQLKGHYFSIRDETLLLGHGNAAGFGNSYQHSDAGYMNALVFGGVSWLICLSIYQYLYSAIPLGITRRRDTPDNKHDFMCFLLLFIYMFILQYKADALGMQHITEVLQLAAGSTYMIKHYYQLENG